MSLRPRRAPSAALSPAEVAEIRAAAAAEIQNAPEPTAQQLATVEMACGPALRASYAQAPHLGSEDAA